MKITKRRRPLRPRPSRRQIRQQVHHPRRQLQLFQVEWLLEAAREDRNPLHLRQLHDRMVACQDAIGSLESL